jgi:lipoate-protein ligase A
LLFLYLTSKNIYKNLATEEYLLKKTDKDFFVLWQSDSAVVFGKHQNPFEEIKISYALKKKYKLARRLSGGGTVFHDLGNVNFSLITTKQTGKQIDFELNMNPVTEFLKSLDINVEISKNHDLFIDKNKISGNAEHIYKNRVLHHGTLLFKSDLQEIKNILFVNNSHFKSNSIKSVKKEMVNISNYLDFEDVNVFMDRLKKFLFKNKYVEKEYFLTNFDIQEISKIDSDKYSKNRWIFGYNPDFKIEKAIIYNNKEIKITAEVIKGKIIKGKIINFNIFIDNILIEKIKNLFLNKDFNPFVLIEIFKSEEFCKEIPICGEDIFNKIF